MPRNLFDRDEDDEFGSILDGQIDFGLRDSGKVIPLPATVAVRKSQLGKAPKSGPGPGAPQGPASKAAAPGPGVAQGVPSSPPPVPQRPDEFRRPFEDDFGDNEPHDPFGDGPENPRIRDPNRPQAPAPPATAGPPGLQALLDAFLADFPLGGSDLSDASIQREASIRFQEIISFMGGSDDLRAEIGDARFVNRLQEFIGKGSTLDQSGVINIGNGVTLNSLRDVADFNQTFAAASDPDAARIAAEGGTSAGVAPVGTGVPGFQQLQRMQRAPGFNKSAFDQTANALRGQLQRERRIGIQQTQEFLAGRGLTGGGIEAQAIEDLTIELNRQMGQRLTEVALAMGLAADENQLRAQANSIQAQQNQMVFALGLLQNQTVMALGQGRLALDNLALNTGFAQAMIGLRIDAAQLILAFQNAANGDAAGAIQMLLDILDQLRGGFA